MLLSEIAKHIDGRLEGNDRIIRGVSTLDDASEDDITFLANSKYTGRALSTKAGAIIVSSKIAKEIPQIIVGNPYHGYAKTLRLLYPQKSHKPGVSDRAYVGEDASISLSAAVYPGAYIGDRSQIGENCVIYPGSYVGEGCIIGDNTVIYPNVSIYEGCIIGKGCIIHAGTVIGSDGYGFVWDGEQHLKIPQVGIVVIGDNVELGANCTVDRAALTKTVIGNGVKTDNMVHIAHNVAIGENSLIVAQAGIAGSTTVGKHVTIAGQAGIIGHLTIGDFCVITSKAGVTSNLPAGSVVSGAPEMDHKKWLRVQAALKKLPELQKRLHELERRLDAKD